MPSSIRPSQSAPDLRTLAAAPESAAAPNLEPLDRFDPASQVQKLQLQVRQSEEARRTADLIFACVAPLITSKGSVDDQIWLLFLRMMGRVQAEARDANRDDEQLERLRERLSKEAEHASEADKARFQQAKMAIEQVHAGRQNQRQQQSDDLSRVSSGLLSLREAQHQAIMATLSGMNAI